MAKKFDVITVGSATVDVFACTEHCESLKGSQRKKFVAYPIGAKILVEDLILSIGGGGTNASVALSRLGHKTAFLGKIGRKDNSGRVVRDLKKENVDTSLIVQGENSRTGYSIILDSFKHDRTILNYRGSNSDLQYREISNKKLNTKWFYFSALRGKSFETMKKIAAFAKRKSISICCVMNPFFARQGIPKLRPVLKHTTIVVMNAEESKLLTGVRFIENAARKLLKLGVKIVVVTDGSRGATVFTQDEMYIGRTINVPVLETTGAGDGFASGFLSGMIQKNDISYALDLGMTNAESVIQYHGAKNILLKLSQAKKIMKKNNRKIVKKKFS